MTGMSGEESADARLKRLRIRSMRRGIKEMDLILIRYADMRLKTLSEQELETYEALLSENDQDLYQWVSDQAPPPAALADMIADIRAVALAGPLK